MLRYVWIIESLHHYIYIYIYVFVCVCMSVCLGQHFEHIYTYICDQG